MATWTTTTKTSMSVTEIDAEFQDASTITFMDAVNMVFREAATNTWNTLAKS